MSTKNNKHVNNFLSEIYDNLDNLINLYKKSSEEELEVSFKKIDYNNYLRIVKHLIDSTDENNIETTNSLDIVVKVDNSNVRVSLLDEDEINNFIAKYSKSNVNTVIENLGKMKKSDTVEIIEKVSNDDNRMPIDEYDMFIKLSKELDTKKKISGDKLLFRYKERVSFIEKNFRIDATVVHESLYLNNLMTRFPKYEIELEIISNKVTTDQFINKIYDMLKLVQDSADVISKKESNCVIDSYMNLLYLKKANHLEARNVISLEPYHVINYLHTNYSVTDKTDGERNFLITYNDYVYLISSNMNIKKTGLKVDKKYNNIIIDGELVAGDKTFFIVFDVIYHDGIDYIKNTQYNLKYRLNVVNEIIDKVFGNLIPFEDYLNKNTDAENDKINAFYKKELVKYWKTFRSKLESSDNLFVTRKLYFIPYGINQSELYMYANLIWTSYVYNNLAPYTLDGLIFTPTNLGYMIKATGNNVDQTPLEYKWKPPKYNSIDYYIEFEKDGNNESIVFFDNSVNIGNNYYIANLHVGLSNKGVEVPINYKVNNIGQKANIYLQDGEPRDINGDVIQDKTVVEFIYNINSVSADNSYNWIPIRTRYDKTESVLKYKMRYGNYLHAANRIWRSIINPVTEDDIKSLSQIDIYDKQIKLLEKVNTIKKIESPKDVYYEKTADIAGEMRAFHNYIKKNMITTYCDDGDSVLDIGCGRGGDLDKFVESGIGSYVGIDIDYSGLFLIKNNAQERYQRIKRNMKNAPQMTFINADAKGIFNVKSQENILANMPETNKENIKKFLSTDKKFDVINCQFSIHYYLSDDISWNNFCKNIKTHIANNGYFLVTTFDGETVKRKLGNKNKINVGYTDNHGNKTTFFEIVKMYDGSEPLGQAIDFHNATISSKGKYIREYLVDKDYLIKSMAEKCGLELVETDMFSNLFQLYKGYFSNINDGGKSINKIKKFYSVLNPDNKDRYNIEELETIMANYKLSALNRYYVFKNSNTIDISSPARVIKINNDIDLGNILAPQLKFYKMKIDPDYESDNLNNLYKEIRHMNLNIRPNTYLISHKLIDDKIDDDNMLSNIYRMTKLKSNDNNNFLIFYRANNGYFYPIYRQMNDDKRYVLNNGKILDDIEMMVALNNKIYS